LPELNLLRPALVRDLHAAYASAGARILQTNTFGANRLRLAAAGLENSVSEINIAPVRLYGSRVDVGNQAASGRLPDRIDP
jgi:methionine synthase I (cobalamin-dependent)